MNSRSSCCCFMSPYSSGGRGVVRLIKRLAKSSEHGIWGGWFSWMARRLFLAYDHTAPLSPKCFPEMEPPPPCEGPVDVTGLFVGGRMSDAFASSHIARFIQAPAVFIRCILGNHFARTGTVLS